MKKIQIVAMAAAASLLALPALAADVKAGIDAWTRGDYKQAVAEWRGPAEHGNADAQFNLGQAYRLGRGVPQDFKKAEEWYRKAAVQGHRQAQDNYGLALFQNGKHGEAVPWLTQSANRGEPRAQFVLGTMYFNGDAVEKDWPRAYALMSRSAAAGLPQASATLTKMDRYITLSDRQEGIRLAQQYERNAANPPAQVADNGPAPLRGQVDRAELPPSNVYQEPAVTIPKPAAPASRPQNPAPQPPVSRPAPQPAAVVRDGGWRIQLGAFGNVANAHRLGDRYAAVFSDRKVYYTPAGRLTKVMIGPFASGGEAARACGQVKARGTPCLTVGP